MFKYQEILKKFCVEKYWGDNFDATIMKHLEEDLKMIAPGNYRLKYMYFNTFNDEEWMDMKPIFDNKAEEIMWLLKWA